jgi:hypothetical protein
MRETFTEARREYIFGREPRIVEHRPVCVDRNAARIYHHNCLRNGVGDPAQFALILPQLTKSMRERALSAFAFDRDTRNVRELVDKGLVSSRGRSGFRVIDRECA